VFLLEGSGLVDGRGHGPSGSPVAGVEVDEAACDFTCASENCSESLFESLPIGPRIFEPTDNLMSRS